MRKFIIIGLFSILIVLLAIMFNKYSALKQENIVLRDYCSIIDSIKIENEILNNKTLLLTEELVLYEHKIDSLKLIKQRVIVKTEYVISESLTDGVQKLKENLRWERY